MNPEQAKKLVIDTFRNKFEKNQFLLFNRDLLNHLDDSEARRLRQAGPYIKKAFQDKIRSFERLGTYTDPKGQTLDVLIVNLQKETTLERARTFQRNFVADYLATGHGKDKDAVLAAFVSPTEEDWRFSFIKLEYSLEETQTGRVKERRELTPARRLSFLVGSNERSHTAQKQFLSLLQNDLSDPALNEIEEAFQIEKVTKEFFRRYRELYNNLREELARLVKKNESVKKEFQTRTTDLEEFIANFSKKLLGQIVFLYFLQKKGWFGVGRDDEWGSGNKQFLRHLFSNRSELGGRSSKSSRPVNFFNDILEPLFYEALAKPKDYDFYSRFHCKIPFLNGGLFEPILDYNWVHTDVLLRDTLFSNDEPTKEGDVGTGILDVFDRFNFTVNEAEPLEKEVAVDPEMLGKVFENLLPENERKGKGTYYTPRVIVHYMCQQSLINYLASHVGDDVNRKDIETLIRFGERFADFEARPTDNNKDKLLPEGIRVNAPELDQLLEEIAVCDPAIGSGAFPVGMMQEIVRTRLALASVPGMPNRKPYELKRHAIQKSLYGVDIDPGAIEIAKLRLWLSLVVDEDDFKTIRPLPNLDYKIMQGNSLLEEFEGVKLFDERVLLPPVSKIETEKAALQERIRELEVQMLDLHKRGSDTRELKKRFSKITDRLAKQKKEVGRPELEETISFLPEDAYSEARIKLEELKELHKQFFDSSSSEEKKAIKSRLDRIEWEFMEATLKEQGEKEALDKLAEHRRDNRKPFFLWKLQFLEVFQDRGGFDIVIANPPYVRQEEIKELKPALRRNYATYAGTADLYVYFYEKGSQLIHPKGCLAYISSNSFLNSAFGERLRNYLQANTTIHEIIDFGETGVFDAVNEPCILIFSKTLPNGHSVIGLKWNEEQPVERIEHEVKEHSFLVQQREFATDGWRLESSAVLGLLARFRKSGKPLDEYVKGRFYYGIKTGLNEAFVIDGTTRSRLIKAHKSSGKIIKPFLRGRDIKRWRVEPQDVWLIFTRRGIDIEKYPAIHEHLKPFKKRLMPGVPGGRKPGSYEWYEIQDNIAYWEEFEHPKIVYQDIARYFGMAWDDSGAYLANTCYFIPSAEKWMLGVLLSSAMKFYVQKTLGSEEGGFIRLFSIHVGKFPVPDTTSHQRILLTRIVDYILFLMAQKADGEGDLSNSRDQLMIRYFEQLIDGMVYELFLVDELHEARKYFFKPLEQETLPDIGDIRDKKVDGLRRIFERLFDRNHVVRQNIFFLDTLESVRIIEGKT